MGKYCFNDADVFGGVKEIKYGLMPVLFAAYVFSVKQTLVLDIRTVGNVCTKMNQFYTAPERHIFPFKSCSGQPNGGIWSQIVVPLEKLLHQRLRWY